MIKVNKDTNQGPWRSVVNAVASLLVVGLKSLWVRKTDNWEKKMKCKEKYEKTWSHKWNTWEQTEPYEDNLKSSALNSSCETKQKPVPISTAAHIAGLGLRENKWWDPAWVQGLMLGCCHSSLRGVSKSITTFMKCSDTCTLHQLCEYNSCSISVFQISCKFPLWSSILWRREFWETFLAYVR